MADNKKLPHKSVVITGGDSGIGKAVAVLFAKHGADIAILYYDQEDSAGETRNEIEALGVRCKLFYGDVNNADFCESAVMDIVADFGKIDILINNAGTQFRVSDIEQMEELNIRKTFNSNIIGLILLTKTVFPYLQQGSSIINTTSSTAYEGHPELLDYAATKGAVVSFTRSLALQAKEKGIRVNAVAPGPVATPLTEKTFGDQPDDPDKPPLERNATPEEVAPTFLFLASDDAAQFTGQVLHPNGGIILNG